LIRHIVLFSAKDPSNVETILAALGRLRDIPDADHLEVVRNARLDQHSGEIDVIVYGEFADAEALARYKAHPIYQETICIVRPLRDLRIAVDYPAP
jgi:stress responsive alpha/beta barrel protein